jgi:hypothetical protein
MQNRHPALGPHKPIAVRTSAMAEDGGASPSPVPPPPSTAMGVHALRWQSPAAVEAYLKIRSLAPRLARLLYCPAIPDATLHTLLDWSEAVPLDDADSAFALDRLHRVAPALVVAFLASHRYSRPAHEDGSSHCIDLHDTGCGTLVGTILSLLATVVVALHGKEGQCLVAGVREDLVAGLNKISAMIPRG